MVFEILYKASKEKKLILIDGGLCHFNKRKDGQLTILEIISIKTGAGSKMLEMLKKVSDINLIIAKCPSDLESNKWWKKRGFTCIREEKTRTTGRKINVWAFEIKSKNKLL